MGGVGNKSKVNTLSTARVGGDWNVERCGIVCREWRRARPCCPEQYEEKMTKLSEYIMAVRNSNNIERGDLV